MLSRTLACCQSEAARHHISGLLRSSARDPRQATRLRSDRASFWQPRVDVAPGGAMTLLARPDLARSRSGRDHVRPGPASAFAEPFPADRSELLRAGRPVPGWAVATAFLAPAVLAGGWLMAGALQPASYSPMHQTISVLAGHSGADRWVMTTALLLVGSCQIATGAGLTAVGMPARILLILTGFLLSASPPLRNRPRARRRAISPSP